MDFSVEFSRDCENDLEKNYWGTTDPGFCCPGNLQRTIQSGINHKWSSHGSPPLTRKKQLTETLGWQIHFYIFPYFFSNSKTQPEPNREILVSLNSSPKTRHSESDPEYDIPLARYRDDTTEQDSPAPPLPVRMPVTTVTTATSQTNPTYTVMV